MYKVLMIDDDTEYIDMLSDFIKDSGFDTTKANSAKEGLELEKDNNYDLIIIDLLLGAIRGTQVAEIIRKHNDESHIIILTNSISDEDEISSLQLGVDEYIKKNTSLNVIVHRLKNVLARGHANISKSNHLLSKNEKIKIDTVNKIVYKNDEFVDLTALEIELTSYFLEHKNELLTREQILKDVWLVDGDKVFIDSRTVDVHIKNIRKKLQLKNIQSIRGVGYRWYEK
ncbi:DNA-binding response OmpR family regulator [Bacilli bacterium PM5-3]|nr:DNA-binding response OmpR family regulator [Bacilli bacterium PM5-3]MDH6604242.1 DNA-binding response OmpR family regulator [Bacilli bacterium PM5-9]